MAATLISFLILSATLDIIVSAQIRSFNVSRGSSLTPTNQSSWLSLSGLYAFGYYQQRNGYGVGITIAKIPEKTVVWTANRDNPTFNSNSTLMLTNEGSLIVRPLEGDDSTIIESSEPIYSASMLDSGNFVLYNSNQVMIWQSFDNPTDTILPDQSLKAEKELVSSASNDDYSFGIFRLKMQSDGNLVQYPVKSPDTGPYAYWVSLTGGLGGNLTLNLDGIGNLYLFNSSVIIKNLTKDVSPEKDAITLMRIDADGIFRTYSHSLNKEGNWSVQWASSSDKCDPKGICGPNSYCITMDIEIDCKCLPGFDFMNPGNWRSGCERNFIGEKCKDENESTKYRMMGLENTVWEDNPYSELSFKTKEDCKKACLEDCNCEAVSFKDGNCKMQKLPLRYGRRLLTDSNIALIKVGPFAPVLNTDPAKEREKKTRTDILIIGIALVAFSIFLLVISGIFIYNSRVWTYKKIFEHGNVELGEDVSLRAFTFAEVEQVTNGFNEELGRGAFGTVYKGVTHNQQVVAVKKLERVIMDGEREFQTEIKVIGRTHHRNLVRLIGYCVEGLNRILVYEYMSNGSLADLLLTPENRPSWDERIAVALDIARGILYLHEECETQIIHCDIKPQNILMDENMRAKICDFGLAKLLKPDQTKTYTEIRGTKGYVAPEWHRKLPVTVKADVYSFGIVLLEIICCRRSIDWSLPEEEAVLEEWVYHCFKAEQVIKLVGDEDVNVRKLERMVKVGLWCIQDESSLRPSMKKVVLMLEGTVEIPVPPSPTSFLSTM